MAEKEREKGKGVTSLPPEKKKSGFVRNLFYLAALLMVVLGFLAYLSFQPQDLTDIHGYRDEPDIIPPAAPDILGMLEGVAKNNETIRISELQLNLFLRGTLRFTQGGLFKNHLEAKGVWVRLEKDTVEIIFERQFKGWRRHTISMFLRPVQREENGVLHTNMQPKRGRWGGTQVWNGFLLLTKSSFDSLASVYSEELKVVKQLFLSKVVMKVTDDYIEFTPPK